MQPIGSRDDLIVSVSERMKAQAAGVAANTFVVPLPDGTQVRLPKMPLLPFSD